VDVNAARQIEHAGWQRSDESNGFLELHDIGILGVQIAKTHCVARLRAVEAAFLDYRDAVVVGERFDGGCAHAAAGASTGDKQAVHAHLHEKAQEWRAEEGAGFLLANYDVARLRCDLGNDGVAVEVGAVGSRLLCRTRILPRPRAGVPVICAPRAGCIDDGEPSVARRLQQFSDRVDPVPGFDTARIAPALDRFEDGRRFVSAKKVIDIDNEQRRALAKALTRTVTRCLEDLFIPFGKKSIPDRFAHITSPLVSFRLRQDPSDNPATKLLQVDPLR